ncbi:MAG: carboxymuconolactone decarboxylase family protein [Pyrinomonadaceae bacterium]|nr:carboxymuconolactone decarboxylase family protein [Pyrinomonadaceae bacterium]
MTARLDYHEKAPGAYKAMLGMETFVRNCGIEHSLLELVKTRASQLNGCAYCIDMHTKDARAGGETEQRLYALSAWREAPFYTQRERAALEWTEAITLISQNEISDDLYLHAREHFDEQEIVNLTLAVVTINGWNRLAIAFRSVPGSYQVSENDTTANAV